MSNDKQQTPVEWLISQVEDFIGLIPVDIINKAKEMQKERMIEFAKQFIDVVNIEDKDIEIIYNETYGGGEQ
jgi:ribosomal 30S subunit maturation factor RimM